MLVQLNSRRLDAPEDLVSLLTACHQRIRHFSQLAIDIGGVSDVPAGEVAQACADVERYFRESFPLHVADEEESIEPRLRGHSAELDAALSQMTFEHHEHKPLLHALLDALRTVAESPSALEPRVKLAAIASPLTRVLERHLLLEEQTIFPAVRAQIPPAVQGTIIDELRRRRRHQNAQGKA